MQLRHSHARPLNYTILNCVLSWPLNYTILCIQLRHPHAIHARPFKNRRHRQVIQCNWRWNPAVISLNIQNNVTLNTRDFNKYSGRPTWAIEVSGSIDDGAWAILDVERTKRVSARQSIWTVAVQNCTRTSPITPNTRAEVATRRESNLACEKQKNVTKWYQCRKCMGSTEIEIDRTPKTTGKLPLPNTSKDKNEMLALEINENQSKSLTHQRIHDHMNTLRACQYRTWTLPIASRTLARVGSRWKRNLATYVI